MSVEEYRFMMTVRIQITGTEARKDAVRDAILTQLQNARTSGNIDQATWGIDRDMVPEGGTIK